MRALLIIATDCAPNIQQMNRAGTSPMHRSEKELRFQPFALDRSRARWDAIRINSKGDHMNPKQLVALALLIANAVVWANIVATIK